MSELAQSLLKCRIEGSVLFLPPLSDGPLKNYNEVRTALLKAGAKYKRNTFVFPNDAQPYIDRLISGESVNIKKEFQFFETPDDLAERLVELSGVKEGHMILEPSAGQGSIVKAINRATGGEDVYCYELMPINQNILKNISTVKLLGQDFLSNNEDEKYDRIIANPPFAKNQDIDHIKKMFEVLRPGGRIVTIASPSWTFGSHKKHIEFREWLDEVGATIEELPQGTFKESGTNIKAMLLVIDKAA